MNKDREKAIRKTVKSYFLGLHHGDTERLKGTFSLDCVLKAPGLRRDMATWLSLVSERAVPAEKGDPFHYKILSVDILGEQAMVKVYCPLLGRHYVDYLGLLFEHGRWRIVNKMYADA